MKEEDFHFVSIDEALDIWNQQDEELSDICYTLVSTLRTKNHDYGNSFSEIFKEEGWPYAIGHLKEKLYRIDQLRKGDAQVKGESIKDSLLDLAGYCILTIHELDKQNSE